MTFPDDWREFLRDFSFKDTEEIYTNGCELIPVFRVEQLIEHLELLKEQEPVAPDVDSEGTCSCGNCGETVGYFPAGFRTPEKLCKYCPECGRKVKWDG